ncbi:MAG TPA: heme-copper oxidase subunit III [Alphaproteobacteria bacterium]|nr:heme-copper oxidase subunit III [Alphaproteobacteria bacterium]
MTDQAVADIGLEQPRVPVGSIRRRGTGWWGVLTLILTEASLFVYLLFSYYYFAFQSSGGFLPDKPPSLELSVPNTVILLLSSVAVWWGDAGVRRGRQRQLVIGLAIALLLGIAFVTIQLFEWREQTFTLRSSQYGSLFYTITGFHMAHVIVGLLVLAVLLVWSALGYFSGRRSAPILIGGAYWHFVDVVWLAVFFTFYITPYLRG